MTGEAFASFLALPEQDRRDVFTTASRHLGTAPDYVEKDFWVCLVLDLLFNAPPEGHPKLLFKGETSLSKAFGLIRRFSKDIDLVVHCGALGFAGDRDRRGRPVRCRFAGAVRTHNLVAFRQAWKRFEEAVPGSLRLVPQERLHAAVKRDYRAMHDTILGGAPEFEWIVDRLRLAEAAANRT